MPALKVLKAFQPRHSSMSPLNTTRTVALTVAGTFEASICSSSNTPARAISRVPALDERLAALMNVLHLQIHQLLERLCTIQVYLAVYLRAHEADAVKEVGVVSSMGDKSFTIHVPRLGITHRMYLDKIADVTSTFDREEEVLHIQSTPAARYAWKDMKLEVFSKVMVKCKGEVERGPIEVVLELIGPYSLADSNP